MAIRTFENKTPVIGNNAHVDETALILGDVEIGEDTSLWPMTVARGDVFHIRIGKRTNVQDNSVLHVTHYGKYGDGSPLIIGDDVTIGHRVIAHACTIGDCCLIGMGSIILDKAVIESHVLLGAGSLVPEGKVLESGYLYFGNPVKQIRKLSNEEIEFLSYSANHYVELKNRHQK
ncbi:MAG: gamma carbonic anhydrase family protein [Gammaproteobacteria bacterium]